MSTFTLLLAAASSWDCGLTCSTTLTFVSLAPTVVARVKALFGLRVALGEAGVTMAPARDSDPVLLGLWLCGMLALPGLPVPSLPVYVVLVKSGPVAKVWCFCAALAFAIASPDWGR